MADTYGSSTVAYGQADVLYNGAVKAAYRAQKGLISGYHCFMKQYIDFTKAGYAPLKLPDGTLW